MLKICLCSDNHGDMNAIRQILIDNPACDYYIHAGDSMVSPNDLSPFISIEGNNDWYFDFPKKRILEIGNHKILLIHGHGYTFSMDSFVRKAKAEHADTVFFGHTHIFMDQTYHGIRFINPGSCYYNRDLSNPCYARVFLRENGTIYCERIDLK